MLPRLPYTERNRQAQTYAFSGINRNPAAGDGSVFDTENMTSDQMPYLAPRKPRYRLGRYLGFNGMIGHDGLYMVLNDSAYKDGEYIGKLGNPLTERIFADMDDRIVVFPDKVMIRTDGQKSEPEDVEWPDETVIAVGIQVDFNDHEITNRRVNFEEKGLHAGQTVTISGSSVKENNREAVITAVDQYTLEFAAGTFTTLNDETIDLTLNFEKTTPQGGQIVPMEIELHKAVRFADGTYGGEAAEGNTLRSGEAGAVSWVWEQTGLKVGDAVKIVGQNIEYGPLIIREMEGPELRFYENSFETTEEYVDVTITKDVPDLDGIFSHENRLWGWKGSTIYASKLTDPTNFYVEDGLTDDSWSVDLGGAGSILGGIVYQGYPMFFKEDAIYRVYGDRASQYRTMRVGTLGVREGCGKSLAVAGEILYYFSRAGFTAFDGGTARPMHTTFGDMIVTDAVAGSDGVRYFVSLKQARNESLWALWVYDTQWSAWFREDLSEVTCFANDRGNLYYQIGGGLSRPNYGLWIDGRSPGIPKNAEKETNIVSKVEFGMFTGANWTAGRNTANPNMKGTAKILLRLTMKAGSRVVVRAKFEGEPWKVIKEILGPESGETTKSYYLPAVSRCDNYRIKIEEGEGEWMLHSLTREGYAGTPMRGRFA